MKTTIHEFQNLTHLKKVLSNKIKRPILKFYKSKREHMFLTISHLIQKDFRFKIKSISKYTFVPIFDIDKY